VIGDKAEPRHRSPHDMRHTFATLSARTGPLTYVSKQLGHADKCAFLGQSPQLAVPLSSLPPSPFESDGGFSADSSQGVYRRPIT
jgi:hypothetical protein